jgi:zinc protease
MAGTVLVLLLMATLATSCALLNAERNPRPKANMTRFDFPNGLTVYALEHRDVPLVTLDMWVRVGAADEPPEVAGISHYLEHMLFKGTPRLGVGEYDRRIEALGGYLNAGTSMSYTHYYLTVPSQHLDAALEDLADVIRNSSIAPAEVEKERGVILEEIRLKEDNPVGFLFDEITRRVFAEGPLAGTVIGSPASVQGITRDQLAEHHRRYYVPSNMTLVISGDINADLVRRRVREIFADWEADLKPWRESLPATSFRPPEEVAWSRDWQQTYFFLVFPGGEVSTIEEVATIDLADQLLTGGRTARLTNSLREKKGLVSTIGSYFMALPYPGFVAIYGTCEEDQLELVRAEIFAELERARSEGFSATDLRRARRQLITEHLYQAETNAGRTGIVGASHVMFEDGSLLEDYPRAVEAVSEDDVRRVLESMIPENASFYVARPAARDLVGAGS